MFCIVIPVICSDDDRSSIKILSNTVDALKANTKLQLNNGTCYSSGNMSDEKIWQNIRKCHGTFLTKGYCTFVM